MARSRPLSNTGREPLNRGTAPNASVRRGVPAQRPALSKSADLATPHPRWWMDGASPSKKKRIEAESTRPGRVVRWAERQRRTLASGADVLPTGGGDRQIADLFRRQSRHCSIKETICVYLRYLWALRWASDVAMASSLCVFVFAMSCSVFLSVSL